MARPVSERRLLFVIGAVQFVNILDFMIVMPMGPDFSRALGIPMSHVGYIAGSYTAAAAVAGLAGSFFLDRFDRRKALLVALVGLVVATALAGLATGLYSLMAARVVAGLFGGPATSLAFSIVADVVPQQRRGKAMGAVMGAFSVAAVLGVPLGLWLALHGWRIPFFTVAAMGAVVALFAARVLPPLRAHLERAKSHRPSSLGQLVRNPDVLLSWTMTAVVMMAGFLILPNLSAYLQENLGYPRERLGLLYGVGGALTFFTARLAGRLVDRFGSFVVGLVACGALVVSLWAGFVDYRPAMPVLALFVLFMAALSFRNVAYNTLTSKVPSADERARFMSVQSAVQHLASAAGAFVSARLLTEGPGGELLGVESMALLAIVLTAMIPVMLRVVEQRVRLRGMPGALPTVPEPAARR
jgi:predicted MFS family arabinose efflux permease